MKNKITVKNLVLLGLLIALNIVLTRLLSIPLSPTIRLSFGFIAIALMGYLFGPWQAALGAALGDMIGCMLFLPGQGFAIGITLSVAVSGIIYGLFFHKKKVHILRVIAAQVATFVVCTLFLTTLALSLLMGKGFLVLLVERAIANLLILPVYCGVLFAVLMSLKGYLKTTALVQE